MADEFTSKHDGPKAVYADLSASECQKLTELEHILQKESGEKIVLIAYQVQ